MTQTVLPDVCDAVVVSADEISARVAELGSAITEAHHGNEVTLVTVLRGGLLFTADLCRAIDAPLTLDFMAVAPFQPGHGGVVRVTKDLSDDIRGSAVVLVEDMVDTGLTLNYVRTLLLAHEPASLEVCALFDKPARRIAEVPLAFRGFELPDRFVVGYGLDLGGRYRNLPYVASVREDVIL